MKNQKQKAEEQRVQQGQYSFASDNRGLSLVELMVALVITVIIMGAAMLFLHTAIKNYEFASGQIRLQKESQISMEQMVTWVMEGNVLEEKTGEILVIYDYPKPVDSSKLPSGYWPPEHYWDSSTNAYEPIVTARVIWQKDDKIYMVKNTNVDVTGGLTADTIVSKKGDYELKENCVAENVDKFSVNVSADNKSVDITMEMKEGKQTFTLVNTATIRNDKLN